MTALSALSHADRQRVLKRLAEASELDRLMRESGTLAPAPEPRPLHQPGREEEIR
jgi:hypothetical protein